jgi:hypothetical protein
MTATHYEAQDIVLEIVAHLLTFALVCTHAGAREASTAFKLDPWSAARNAAAVVEQEPRGGRAPSECVVVVHGRVRVKKEIYGYRCVVLSWARCLPCCSTCLSCCCAGLPCLLPCLLVCIPTFLHALLACSLHCMLAYLSALPCLLIRLSIVLQKETCIGFSNHRHAGRVYAAARVRNLRHVDFDPTGHPRR